MTRIMTATEFKATVLAVLDDVADGEEVEVTKHGRRVARIVPIRDSAGLRGRYEGVVSSSSSDDEVFGTGEAWDAS